MTKRRVTFCLLYFLLIAIVGCAHRHVAPRYPIPRPRVYRFTHCAKNGETEVCECNTPHVELNAKTNQEVVVCD